MSNLKTQQPLPEYKTYNNTFQPILPNKVIVEPVQTQHAGKWVDIHPTIQTWQQPNQIVQCANPCQTQAYSSQEIVIKPNQNNNTENQRILQLQEQLFALQQDNKQKYQLSELKSTINQLSNELRSIQTVQPVQLIPTQPIVPIAAPIFEEKSYQKLLKKVDKLKQQKHELKQEILTLRSDLEGMLIKLQQKDVNLSGYENELRNISQYLENVCKQLNLKLQYEIDEKLKCIQRIKELENLLFQDQQKREQNMLIICNLQKEISQLTPLIQIKDQQLQNLLEQTKYQQTELIELKKYNLQSTIELDKLQLLNTVIQQKDVQLIQIHDTYHGLLQQYQQLQMSINGFQSELNVKNQQCVELQNQIGIKNQLVTNLQGQLTNNSSNGQHIGLQRTLEELDNYIQQCTQQRLRK